MILVDTPIQSNMTSGSYLTMFFTHFLTMFYIVPFTFTYSNEEAVNEAPNYIDNAIPFFFLFAFCEFLYGKWRKYPVYSVKDSIMSLSLGTVQQLIGLWFKEIAYIPYIMVFRYSQPLRQGILEKLIGTGLVDPSLFSSEYSSLWSVIYFLLGFIGCDISYYFMHRYAHELHVFWGSHSVHHSGERYNLFTALRQGSYQSAYSWAFYLPWAVIGLPPIHYLRHNRLNTIYQFWIHTEMIGRLPWFVELIMNTASHHRLHHRPPGNCNYAGVLIIWDRLFGTFVAECSVAQDGPITVAASAVSDEVSEASASLSGVKGDYKRSVVYGLSKPLISYDPIKANIQHFINLSYSRTKIGGSSSLTNLSETVPVSERMKSLFSLIWRKRVHHPLLIVNSFKTFAPDIEFDWMLEDAYFTEHKDDNPLIALFSFYWKRMWTLPPAIPSNEEVQAILHPSSYHKSSSNSTVKATTTRRWTVRDLLFLEGREKRNLPILSSFTSCLLTLHFVSILLMSLFLLECHTWPFFYNTTLGRMYAALFTVVCLLLMQTIQFHYFPTINNKKQVHEKVHTF
jgi:sterol desaturase/sphingolipid hydroxylase (fatty acid hydroxylase superfamily)